MNDISTGYAYHLDEIRRTSHIKVNDFCDGICSDRQYRRYISGKQDIPQKIIIKLCERIGLRPSDFFNSFYRNDVIESKKIGSIYTSIIERNFEQTYILIENFKTHKFINIQAKRLYEFCIIMVDYLTKKTTKFHAYDLYKSIIDYPQCLSKSAFDFVDIITIEQIAQIEVGLGKEEALLFLYKILFDREFVYVSSDTRHIFPLIYSELSKSLGIVGKINESLEIANKGIEYSIKIAIMHALPHLYYYKSLCLFKLGKVNESFSAAKKCLATTIAKDNDYEFKMFSDNIRNDFNINPMDLFIPGFIRND